jgi:hypothetical protein
VESEKKQENDNILKQVKKVMPEKVKKASLAKKQKGLQNKKAARNLKEEEVNLIKEATNYGRKDNSAQKNLGKKATVVVKEKNEEEEKKEDDTSLVQIKKFLCSIIQMDEPALKALCKQKEIMPKGRATMKHKYVFTLLRDALIQLNE